MTRVIIIADSDAELDALPADLVYRANLAMITHPDGGYIIRKARRSSLRHAASVVDAMGTEFDLSDI